MLIPEFSDLEGDDEKYLFTYSIRMSLLSEGCNINGIIFDSCQLYWRNWVIRANNRVVSDANGEAVIGKVQFGETCFKITVSFFCFSFFFFVGGLYMLMNRSCFPFDCWNEFVKEFSPIDNYQLAKICFV